MEQKNDIYRDGKNDPGEDNGPVYWFQIVKRGPREDILRCLGGADEEGLTFKQLANQVKGSPSKLAYHLKILVDEGLLVKSYNWTLGRRDYSHYRLTINGLKLLDLMRDLESEDYVKQPSDGKHDILNPDRIEILYHRTGPRSLILY